MIEVNEKQLSNALYPMDVTESGMLIEANEEQ